MFWKYENISLKKMLFLGLILFTASILSGVVHHYKFTTFHRKMYGILETRVKDELKLTEFFGLLSTEERNQRMSNLNTSCSSSTNFPKSLSQLNPKQRDTLLRHVFVNEEYKFLYCYVPKVSCSNWKRVLMKLQNISHPENEEVLQAIPTGLKVLLRYKKEQVDSMIKNYYKFMVVRHPLERTVSAYIDKFVNREYMNVPKEIKTKYRGAGNEMKGPKSVTPEEFVRFLIDQKRDETMDEHWQPMNSICQPCLMKYDTIGSLDHMIEDSEDILREIKAPPNVHFQNRKQNYRKPTSLNVTTSFFSRVNETYIQQLVQKFSYDYDLFSFPFPDSKFFV